MTPSTLSMLDKQVLQHRAETDVALLRLAEEFLDTVSFPWVVDPTGPYLEAIEGGKRFRALCCAIGAASTLPYVKGQSAADALGAISCDPAVIALGCALEFYQASALVHDDLLDNSPTRRGRPSAHVYFQTLHAGDDLLGDPTLFGRDGAVLVGNLLTSAGEYALSAALSASADASRLLRAYSKMTGEVAVGQLADTTAVYLPLTTDRARNVAATLDIVRYKSARYSIMNPAKLGAIALGASEEILTSLHDILEPAGIAFQLRDDALGVFGQDATTGKPTGIDVTEGKRTVLLALTLQAAPTAVAERIIEIYGKQDRSAEEVLYVVDAMAKYGSDPHEALIAEYQGKAHEALERSGFKGATKQLLEDLVGRVISREA